MKERPLFWHYPHYGNQGGAPAAAVRLGDWKLIEWLEDCRTELYHLANDIGETTDLSTKGSGRAAAMLAILHAWLKDVGAERCMKNPAYDPSKPNGRGMPRIVNHP